MLDCDASQAYRFMWHKALAARGGNQIASYWRNFRELKVTNDELKIVSFKTSIKVLKCFKTIHRTRQLVFRDDENALQMGRSKINEEFKKHKNISNTSEIEELIKYSREVEMELKTTIIQAREVKPGVYEAQIRPEIVRVSNVPFQEEKL